MAWFPGSFVDSHVPKLGAQGVKICRVEYREWLRCENAITNVLIEIKTYPTCITKHSHLSKCTLGGSTCTNLPDTEAALQELFSVVDVCVKPLAYLYQHRFAVTTGLQGGAAVWS